MQIGGRGAVGASAPNPQLDPARLPGRQDVQHQAQHQTPEQLQVRQQHQAR